tara:strand:+ start:763 stop:1503 length:741 start_codon:yes stop_codon:yes gene_type:complete
MTILEFSNEFDIYYNSIASNSAPGIDLYEKSVYLTKAQLEIVKNYFNPNGNKYKEGFESSTKRRYDLKELIVDFKGTIKISTTDTIDSNSQIFSIPSDMFITLQESATITSSDTCLNNKVINVKPVAHDEYNIQKGNPFKKPDSTVIWKLDIASNTSNQLVELISPYSISKYNLRYIKKPEPIVLTNLTTDFSGESLSIDGIATSQTCKLSESLHREIIDRAVELALSDYKQNNLAVKTQLNSRNE